MTIDYGDPITNMTYQFAYDNSLMAAGIDARIQQELQDAYNRSVLTEITVMADSAFYIDNPEIGLVPNSFYITKAAYANAQALALVNAQALALVNAQESGIVASDMTLENLYLEVNAQALALVYAQALALVNAQALALVNAQALALVNAQALALVNAQALALVNGQTLIRCEHKCSGISFSKCKNTNECSGFGTCKCRKL
jgi:hypothetical protein